MSKIRIVAAVHATRADDANQLTMVLAEGPEDVRTYFEPYWMGPGTTTGSTWVRSPPSPTSFRRRTGWPISRRSRLLPPPRRCVTTAIKQWARKRMGYLIIAKYANMPVTE